MGLCNKCLAKSGVISKPCITMILVVGLKNAGLIGKQLASSVWQGIHEERGIQEFQAKRRCRAPDDKRAGCLPI